MNTHTHTHYTNNNQHKSPSPTLTPCLKFNPPDPQVHIMRLLVMRLLNHWGWDVANYDSDAIVLKNLEKRFAQFPDKHLIGSVGHFPQQLAVRWGAAVCIGVVLIRAARETGRVTLLFFLSLFLFLVVFLFFM